MTYAITNLVGPRVISRFVKIATNLPYLTMTSHRSLDLLKVS